MILSDQLYKHFADSRPDCFTGHFNKIYRGPFLLKTCIHFRQTFLNTLNFGTPFCVHWMFIAALSPGTFHERMSHTCCNLNRDIGHIDSSSRIEKITIGLVMQLYLLPSVLCVCVLLPPSTHQVQHTLHGSFFTHPGTKKPTSSSQYNR